MSKFRGRSFPPPNAQDTIAGSIGKVLFSVDGISWFPQLPLASNSGGWMTNDIGILLVVGEKA